MSVFPPAAPPSHPSPALARLLAAVAALAIAATAVLGLLLLQERRRPPALEGLTADQRQALARSLRSQSPGIYAWAWYAPAIGYTLHPGQPLSAWADTFTPNELGYRSGPVAKPPGTLRAVFVGDSWTFGMGVREEQAFPRRFAALAGRWAGAARPVEAWTLALPGYNTLNEVAALEYFFDRLQPDVVVLCPTPNDTTSSARVLPDGSLTYQGIERDDFGHDQAVFYRTRAVDSFRSRQRWQIAFAAVRRLEQRLEARGVPLLLFFTGTWFAPWAHWQVAGNGIDAPYVVTPAELSVGEWRNPPPVKHPTPAAHDLYARIVYAGVAEQLGWPALPAEARAGLGDEQLRVHRRSAAAEDWQAASEHYLRQNSRRYLAETFTASAEAWPQTVGLIDAPDGAFGRAAAVLVRRAAGVEALRVVLAPAERDSFLYPLQLVVRIPSPAGGSRRQLTVASGDREEITVEIPLPPDIPVGAAVDVELRVDRAVAGPGAPLPRSLRLLRIEGVE
ncbi:MAG TPA: SGNH/GDSL hydrolase family protein [Thermoanaerobaculia bacterium]|nr:SGNH/GDSL hydrolase family protein [Thermoanaerobaculia bacterium]